MVFQFPSCSLSWPLSVGSLPVPARLSSYKNLSVGFFLRAPSQIPTAVLKGCCPDSGLSFPLYIPLPPLPSYVLLITSNRPVSWNSGGSFLKFNGGISPSLSLQSLRHRRRLTRGGGGAGVSRVDRCPPRGGMRERSNFTAGGDGGVCHRQARRPQCAAPPPSSSPPPPLPFIPTPTQRCSLTLLSLWGFHRLCVLFFSKDMCAVLVTRRW